ncbi:MAG TPA: hypothetical protein PK733_06065 [Clostridiales bacterium]|nr:hypothetical protein [Clostridiales bacterium]
MIKKHAKYFALVVAVCIAISTVPSYNRPQAGALADLFDIKDDTGGFVVDNTYDYFAIGKLSDWGESTGNFYVSVGQGADLTKYRPEKAAELINQGNKIINLGNGLRAGGQILNIYNTAVDTYKLFTEESKHETMVEKGIDKTLFVVDVGMGWYAVGAGAIALFTAPAWGAGLVAAAGATGTTYLVSKLGVGAARIAFNSETYRNASRYVRNTVSDAIDLATGKKKLVFAPLQRPGIKEGLDIIEEELGFDLYPGLRREIPDPSTGIPVYKPNIYLYSDANMSVNVKLYPGHWITLSDPIYPENEGWTAQIVNGSLNGKGDYLFYEALVPDSDFQKKNGWKIRWNSRRNDIIKILDKYSFNEKEKSDFLEYWTEKLVHSKDYIFYPQENIQVDTIMPVILSKEPDNIFRIWFYIEPNEGQDTLEPEQNMVINRNGFTVVEWGGILASEH